MEESKPGASEMGGSSGIGQDCQIQIARILAKTLDKEGGLQYCARASQLSHSFTDVLALVFTHTLRRLASCYPMESFHEQLTART